MAVQSVVLLMLSLVSFFQTRSIQELQKTVALMSELLPSKIHVEFKVHDSETIEQVQAARAYGATH